MEQDARCKRAQFIDRTSDIREIFSFAHPEQIIKAGQVYASDVYGFMLYDLSCQASQSYMRSWNTFVKLLRLFDFYFEFIISTLRIKLVVCTIPMCRFHSWCLLSVAVAGPFFRDPLAWH